MKRKKSLDNDTVQQILAAIQLLSNIQALLSENGFAITDDEPVQEPAPTGRERSSKDVKMTPEQFFSDEYISIIQAHKRFGIPRELLYRHAKSKDLMSILVGKRKRMTTRPWIEEYLAKQARGDLHG